MNLIASVLHLDRASVKALRITDVYSLHRVVYSLYEDRRDETAKAAGHSSGILFADQGGDFHGRKILLLADRMPAERVPGVDGFHGQVQSRPITADFLQHEHYGFKVCVNPTRRDNVSGKIIPVRGREAVARWFMDRAAKNWGFHIDADRMQVNSLQVLQFADKAQRPVTLAQAQIQGRLNVIDRDQFCQSFSHGIGRGKAFGCGLLQIVPIAANPFI